MKNLLQYLKERNSQFEVGRKLATEQFIRSKTKQIAKTDGGNSSKKKFAFLPRNRQFIL